jgi:hypothetical protein
MIGYPNRIDAAALSSGSWAATLPLANLQNRVLGKVARSTDATVTSTKFDIDLSAPKNIRVLALVNHNLSLLATVRIRGATDAAFASTVYDSGYVAVWPVVYFSTSIDWEDDNWWSGQ